MVYQCSDGGSSIGRAWPRGGSRGSGLDDSGCGDRTATCRSTGDHGGCNRRMHANLYRPRFQSSVSGYLGYEARE
jgi:hypothetical protein